MSQWLGSGFVASLARFGGRPALSVAGEELSYAALAGRAGALAQALGELIAAGPALTAVLAARSVPAYAGILAALFRGNGYVPLNPRFPAARLSYVLAHSGCRSLIVDARGEAVLDALLADAEAPLRVVLADRSDAGDIARRHPRHDIRPGLTGPCPLPPVPAVAPDAPAYLLYTSGSTGRPKGVAVSHANVAHFLGAMAGRCTLSESDRFSQMFDLMFDLSVFDLFMAWRVGGCVCCPDDAELMLPAEFIRRAGITVWFSVPSVAVLLNRLRQLEPGAFPRLRYSLFCGEPLPAAAAVAWAAAAPSSVVENLYGPTELTLACMAWRLPAGAQASGTAPIGAPLAGLVARVVTPELTDVAPGEAGELLVSGPQVALGYWNDPEKTAAAFVRDPATGARAYRTGDLVLRPQAPDGPVLFLGRIDHQIKLHGHRIELGEIEAVLGEATGAAQVVVVGWPMTADGPSGLVAFLQGGNGDAARALQFARDRLPAYMIPKSLHFLDDFPMTPNGKTDRRALIELLSAQ